MTEIAFYHLVRSRLEDVLPQLLEKTLAAGKRAIVLAGLAERVEALNVLLWSHERDSWLPHGSEKDGNPADQPIWLSDQDANPNGATFLFLTDGAGTSSADRFERVFELFDGSDQTSVAAARKRWAVYRAAGHAVTYWLQGERGWEEKA